MEPEHGPVAFRETISTSAEAEGRFIRQSGQRIHHVIVRLRVEPLEQGKGFEFASAVGRDTFPEEYTIPIEDGVRAAIEAGVLAGYPIIDVRVTFLNVSYKFDLSIINVH